MIRTCSFYRLIRNETYQILSGICIKQTKQLQYFKKGYFMQTYEEQKAFVSKLNVIDDVIDRVIKETGTVVENGTHEIYVNAAIDDKSDIAELMQYFKKSVGQNPKFPKTCN